MSFAMYTSLWRGSARSSKCTMRRMSSLVFQTYGAPSSVLKVQPAAAVGSPASKEVKVSIKSLPILVEDILAVKGCSFQSSKLGVAGSTSVGIVAAVGDKVKSCANENSVFVVSDSCWAKDVIVPESSVFTIPKLSTVESTVLPATISAYGILSRFKTLQRGETVVQLNSDSDIGQAISQIGKDKGINIINATPADLSDPKQFMAKIGSIKYAISGSPGKLSLSLLRTLSDNAILINYNSSTFLKEDFGGFDLPVGPFIFKNISIQGFNLSTWAKTDNEGFKDAIKNVVALIQAKKISLKSQIFPLAEYSKAILAVEQAPGAVIGTFIIIRGLVFERAQLQELPEALSPLRNL
eukprot:gene875-1700_t